MEAKDSGLPTSLAAIAPADMLNVWNATKLSSKSGTVNTADGKHICQKNFPSSYSALSFECDKHSPNDNTQHFQVYFVDFFSFFAQR